MEIIHYNPNINWKFSSMREKYIDLKLDWDFPFLDRSETIPHFLNTKPLSKPLSYDSTFNLTFADIVDSYSNIILSSGKQVNVFWSGGLDSTALLVGLLSNATDKSQIRILGTYNSIIESGYMYDTFFKKFNSIIDLSAGKQSFNKDELYVTGALGNQLFTLGSYHLDYDIDKMNTPYRDTIDPKEFEFLEPAMSKSPIEIKTLEDYLWFTTFMFKWDHQRLAMINKWFRPSSVKIYLDSFVGFYYYTLFEQWSIHRNEQQYSSNNYEYTSKLPMRKYILSRLGKNSTDYVNGKKITHSVFTPFKNDYMFTSSDLEVYYDSPLQF